MLDGLVDFGSGQVLLQRAASAPATAGGLLRTARRMRLIVALIAAVSVIAVAPILEPGEALFLGLASLYLVTHVLELSTLGWRDRIAWRSPVLVRAGASLASLAFVLLMRATGEQRALAYLTAIAAGSTLGNFALHAFGRRARATETANSERRRCA